MEKQLQLANFLEHKHLWVPEHLKHEMGQFNVFPLYDPHKNVNCQPYNRKGFYKISLINGATNLYYADKNLKIEQSGLLFSNPYIPYSWESVGEKQGGFFCVFTEAFFNQQSAIREYPLFKPGNIPLFELSTEQTKEITRLFKAMLEEIESDFRYKYDSLRNKVLELVYMALKMRPAKADFDRDSNARLRVSSLFMELLERQFPITSPSQRLRLRSPKDFAGQLSIHVNHLNRSLKETTGKTTGQLIAARVMQEARVLLRHTDWNISEIGWALGFEELPHFINFFKKCETSTPSTFRKGN